MENEIPTFNFPTTRFFEPPDRLGNKIFEEWEWSGWAKVVELSQIELKEPHWEEKKSESEWVACFSDGLNDLPGWAFRRVKMKVGDQKRDIGVQCSRGVEWVSEKISCPKAQLCQPPDWSGGGLLHTVVCAGHDLPVGQRAGQRLGRPGQSGAKGMGRVFHRPRMKDFLCLKSKRGFLGRLRNFQTASRGNIGTGFKCELAHLYQ